MKRRARMREIASTLLPMDERTNMAELTKWRCESKQFKILTAFRSRYFAQTHENAFRKCDGEIKFFEKRFR